MMATSRKLNGVQFLWTCRHIGVNHLGNNDSPNLADRTAIEWFKIQTGSSLSLAESGRIYDTAATNPKFYFLPSLAVNQNGDMLLGFSGSSMTNYVGNYYWGRLNGGAAPASPILYHDGIDCSSSPRASS